MILESNVEFDKLYIEVVKCELMKKYPGSVKDVFCTKDKYELNIVIKSKEGPFCDEYWGIRKFIDSLYPLDMWLGDLTYTQFLVKEGRINVI